MPPTNQRLLLTERGKNWLAQFDPVDEESASRLANALVLVSESTFDRIIKRRIEHFLLTANGPVALFAVREIKFGVKEAFVQSFGSDDPLSSMNATPSGANIGSEGRVAATLRSLCGANPATLLNHPNIAAMRLSKCKHIVVVDDLIGSGRRVKEFLSALWENPSLRSWVSRKNIQVVVLSYAATEAGIAEVQNLKCKPMVIFDRACPTVETLPWSKSIRSSVKALCKRYASRTSRKHMALGYGKTMATLVFEHGCPNNVPAIFWATAAAIDSWQPLFPANTVMSEESSVFPPEMVKREPSALLSSVGQTQLASLRDVQRLDISDNTLIILAFSAKGVRTTSALSFATGMNDAECVLLFRQCVEWGFLTQSYRITTFGLSELASARSTRLVLRNIAPRGEDDYYPKMLRSST